MSSRSVTIRMLVPSGRCDGNEIAWPYEYRIVRALSEACHAEDIEIEVEPLDPDAPEDQDLAWKERP